MNKKNAEVHHGGQIIFSPSGGFYESLPGFIKGWAVTDIVFAGIWCVVALFAMAAALWMQSMACPVQDVLQGFLYAAVVAVAGGLGLYANILLLGKKPRAISAAWCLIVLTILHILWNAYQMFGAAFWGPENLRVILITAGVVSTAARIALLVFYWSAICRASRYFQNRRLRLGF